MMIEKEIEAKKKEMDALKKDQEKTEKMLGLILDGWEYTLRADKDHSDRNI